MPQTPKGRSGDLGEILATELVEEEIGLRVPVRRLRYKDGRNMAMRGDDFIGAGYDAAGEKPWLLKGEAKSNKVLGKATVTSARKVLNRDNGRCTPDSLLFVAGGRALSRRGAPADKDRYLDVIHANLNQPRYAETIRFPQVAHCECALANLKGVPRSTHGFALREAFVRAKTCSAEVQAQHFPMRSLGIVDIDDMDIKIIGSATRKERAKT